MRISSALVVDEIKENEDGRVDLLGLREDLYFETLPVILERLTVFIDLEIGAADCGRRHTLELRVVDPENTVISSVPIRFALPADYPRSSAPLDPTLFEVPFQRYGAHSLHIWIEGEVARRLPLNILPPDAE